MIWRVVALTGLVLFLAVTPSSNEWESRHGLVSVAGVMNLTNRPLQTLLRRTSDHFVCSNGMTFGLKDSRLRRRHVQSLDPEDIAAYLREQLDQRPEEQTSGTNITTTVPTGVEVRQKTDADCLDRDVDCNPNAPSDQR